MNIEEQLKKWLSEAEDSQSVLGVSIISLWGEEDGPNDPETIEAWRTIIHKNLCRFREKLELYKENIRWSMLDEHRESFRKLQDEFDGQLEDYKNFDEKDEGWQKFIIQTLRLLDEGAGGFRQGFLSDTYYVDLLHKEKERYRQENYDRMQNIYQQDAIDLAFEHPDETERKSYMKNDCRKQFFNTRFGKEFHNLERDEKKISLYIVEQKEQGYQDINEFLGKWLAYEIAEEHCREKHELVYQNLIFKDNVDVNKVMEKLAVYVREVLSSQRHWYIVYKVFEKKKWMKKNTTQAKFRDQMNAAFKSARKCTKDDFGKVDIYFKRNDYADWSTEAPQAPSCCKDYKNIALKLDQEFQDNKYAKPGTIINTRKIEKFR